MKLQKQITIAALALAGAAWMPTKASATTVAGNDGDLILGFRDPTNTATNNLMVDIGAPANYVTFATNNPGGVMNLAYGSWDFADTGVGSTVNGGGLSTADLTTAYTSNWATLSNQLSWSVFGYDGSPTLYGTFSGTVAHKLSSGGESSLITNQLTPEDSSFLGATSMQSPEAANLTAPYSLAIRNGNGGSFTKDYNALTQSTETLVPSTGSAIAQLWIIPPGSTSQSPPAADDIGYFTMGSNGSFSFTAAGTATPEPSTIGLLGMAGAGVVGMMRRRRPVAA